MPYIDQASRDAIDQEGHAPATVGELTYVLYRAALDYAVQQGICYQTFAEVLAALDATSKEFYRRQVAPYEDEKIAANGDVL
jgi:hypothetical protein